MCVVSLKQNKQTFEWFGRDIHSIQVPILTSASMYILVVQFSYSTNRQDISLKTIDSKTVTLEEF